MPDAWLTLPVASPENVPTAFAVAVLVRPPEVHETDTVPGTMWVLARANDHSGGRKFSSLERLVYVIFWPQKIRILLRSSGRACSVIEIEPVM